jgi:hypothetical protein
MLLIAVLALLLIGAALLIAGVHVLLGLGAALLVAGGLSVAAALLLRRGIHG